MQMTFGRSFGVGLQEWRNESSLVFARKRQKSTELNAILKILDDVKKN